MPLAQTEALGHRPLVFAEATEAAFLEDKLRFFIVAFGDFKFHFGTEGAEGFSFFLKIFADGGRPFAHPFDGAALPEEVGILLRSETVLPGKSETGQFELETAAGGAPPLLMTLILLHYREINGRTEL